MIKIAFMEAKMSKQYGYEIREKETNFLAGDDGEIYYPTKELAMHSAKRYTENFLIPNEYNGKALEDFTIIIRELND